MTADLIRVAAASAHAGEMATQEATPSTFLGLGLIATGALVVWLIRRSRV
jgi:hypothetical protein